MSIRQFLTLPRGGGGYCTTLVALAILAAPGLTWGACNSTGDITTTPSQTFATPSTLGTLVTVRYEFGGGTLEPTEPLVVKDILGNLNLASSVFKVAQDCTTAQTSANREACLEFVGNDGSSGDDGDAIIYKGNYTNGNLSGAACPNLVTNAIVDSELPNVLTFTAGSQVSFQTNDLCFVEFDVEINGVGDTPEPNSAVQAIAAAAGFDGECNPLSGADATVSLIYYVELDRDIEIVKEVCLSNCGDEANWYNANSETPPDAFPIGIVDSSLFQYRVTVTNTGEEPLTDVVISDNSPPLNLGLVNAPIPGRCLDPVDTGAFQPGDSCTIVSGDAGFTALGDVQACLTEGNKTNTACTNGQGEFTLLPAVNPDACDPATVKCIAPGIEVRKDGPAVAKVGDTITYSICADNTGATDLASCTVTDGLLGLAGAAFPDLPIGATNVCLAPAPTYTVQVGDPNPLPNTASVTCNVVGTASDTVSDNDDHSVDLIDPSIDVTKTGPDSAKVGDEITYTIGFTDTSVGGILGICTGNDPLLGGDLGVFTAGVTRDFTYTVQVGDPNPLLNTATITCDVEGFDNKASDNASHSVDLIDPSVTLAKECTPDPVAVGATVNWEITVNNTGNVDLNCLVNDSTAGYIDEPVAIAAGGSQILNASETVEAGDGPVISNTAIVDCPIPGFDNSLHEEATADCEVTTINELCRTPGFWKTHGGAEKAGRSTNLVWEVIDSTPGDTLGTICGDVINNTSVDGYSDVPAIQEGDGYGSALEGMCVHPKQQIIRQLQRQLIAASLNCVISGGGANCSGMSVEKVWQDANTACATNTGNLSDWVDMIDDFNNGRAPYTCSENIKVSDVFEGVEYKVPGPAGSSNACSAATSNDFYLVP